MAGCVPILGRLHSAAVFRLDDCMRPIYGEAAGFVDDCFAALETSDNLDEGTTFTRRCASGAILYHDDGEQSLRSVTVSLDLNAEPDAGFLAGVGLITPVLSGTETIGWTRCTRSVANLLVAVWQEVLGADACDDDELGVGGWRLHLFPLRRARLTLQGNLGAEDGYVRITGNTVPEANLGLGPIPLLLDDGVPVWPETDLSVCHHTALTHGVIGPPDECGVINTVAPDAAPPTGVALGAPGAFLPSGAGLPANLAALIALGALGQTAAWTEGQYVVLGDESSAHWSGDEWVAGPAPS